MWKPSHASARHLSKPGSFASDLACTRPRSRWRQYEFRHVDVFHSCRGCYPRDGSVSCTCWQMFVVIPADKCHFSLRIRVAVFMKLSATEMVVQIAAAPLVAALMRLSNWYGLGISSIPLVVAGLIASMLPEIHPQRRGTILVSSSPVREQVFISGNSQEAQLAKSGFQLVQKLVLRSYATSGDFVKSPGILLSLSVFLLAS